MTTPAIDLISIRKVFRSRKGLFGGTQDLVAIDDLSLTLARGETLGLVGESGCGKSTAVNIMLGLHPPDQGRVVVGGRDISRIPIAERARLIQPVFQNPNAALNPVRRIGDLIGQPLRLNGGTDVARQVREMMDLVGLPDRLAGAYPAELSGGQRQRAAIARALILRPEVLICDEPTSALDVSVQAQVINLLIDLKAEMNLTMVFVSHNLAVIEHLADRVAVMYLGRKVEEAPVAELFANARHPYSRALLASTLAPDPAQPLQPPQLGSTPADPFSREPAVPSRRGVHRRGTGAGTARRIHIMAGRQCGPVTGRRWLQARRADPRPAAGALPLGHFDWRERCPRREEHRAS